MVDPALSYYSCVTLVSFFEIRQTKGYNRDCLFYHINSQPKHIKYIIVHYYKTLRKPININILETSTMSATASLTNRKLTNLNCVWYKRGGGSACGSIGAQCVIAYQVFSLHHCPINHGKHSDDVEINRDEDR